MKRGASSGRYRGYPSIRCTARSSARQPGSSESAFGRMRIGTSLAPGVPLKDRLADAETDRPIVIFEVFAGPPSLVEVLEYVMKSPLARSRRRPRDDVGFA